MNGNDKRVDVLCQLHRNESDWQRHNESQRGFLLMAILAIDTALIRFLPSDRSLNPNDWPIPAFMLLLSAVGFISVLKYWERFMHHADVRQRFEYEIDKALGSNGTESSFVNARDEAEKDHDKKTFPLLRDKRLMQHWIWLALNFLMMCFALQLLCQTKSPALSSTGG